jgi:HSP20 family protein
MFRRPLTRYSYTPSLRTSPWREVDRLQRELSRLADEAFTAPRISTAPSYPAMNIWTNEEGAVLTAELPGINVDDLDISVVGDTLTLKGSRTADEMPEEGRYHRRERTEGSFSRTFQLPFQVEVDKVEAMFEKGILHLSLPRAEVDKPKKIMVKVA